MSFLPLPYELSAGWKSTTFQNTDVHWDYVIGGIPFFGAQSKDRPMKRQTADYRKEQLKTGSTAIADPSQLSTEQWWLAGQSSFHGGGDQLYIDTPSAQSQDVQPLRFYASEGIDIFKQGQFSLLHTTAQLGSDLTTCVGMFCVTGSVIIADSTYVYRYNLTTGARVVCYTSASASIKAMGGNGSYWFCVDNDGVWRGASYGSGTGGTKIYTVPGSITSAEIGWVKMRIMLGLRTSTSSKAYELNSNPAGQPAALPTPVYTSPDTNWEWNGICDAPGAILMGGGSSGMGGGIIKFTLHTDGTTPTLVQGSLAAQLPLGEIVYNIAPYLGSALAVCTSAGLRVGQFTGSGGDFSMGPLSIEQSASDGQAVGINRFLYYTFNRANGTTGLARLDLSQQLSIRQYSYVPDMRYAWTTDVLALDGSGNPVSGAFYAQKVSSATGTPCFYVSGKGIFLQNNTNYVKSGYLTTSRIRMSTLDLKVFRYVRIRGEGSGRIAVGVGTNTDNPTTISSIVVPNHPDSGDLAISGGPATWATVTITLTQGSATTTPICHGYQLKALCAQKRQRLIQLPLSCFDYEEDSSGQETGGLSTAYLRLRALEAVEEAGDICTYQALSPYDNQQETRLATIDQIQFEQTSMPTDEQGWGGYLLVTLRTVD